MYALAVLSFLLVNGIGDEAFGWLTLSVFTVQSLRTIPYTCEQLANTTFITKSVFTSTNV